jgi:hypothetical protein
MNRDSTPVGAPHPRLSKRAPPEDVDLGATAESVRVGSDPQQSGLWPEDPDVADENGVNPGTAVTRAPVHSLVPRSAATPATRRGMGRLRRGEARPGSPFRPCARVLPSAHACPRLRRGGAIDLIPGRGTRPEYQDRVTFAHQSWGTGRARVPDRAQLLTAPSSAGRASGSSSIRARGRSGR